MYKRMPHSINQQASVYEWICHSSYTRIRNLQSGQRHVLHCASLAGHGWRKNYREGLMSVQAGLSEYLGCFTSSLAKSWVVQRLSAFNSTRLINCGVGTCPKYVTAPPCTYTTESSGDTLLWPQWSCFHRLCWDTSGVLAQRSSATLTSLPIKVKAQYLHVSPILLRILQKITKSRLHTPIYLSCFTTNYMYNEKGIMWKVCDRIYTHFGKWQFLI